MAWAQKNSLQAEARKVQNPLVSAIIANRNGARHLRLCLPSLLAQTYQPLEVIVADNDSSDDSAQVAREFGVRWIPLHENRGLAAALNGGAARACGEFLLFLNNDMRFDEGFVAALADVMARDEEIFAADALQYNWEGTAIGHSATCITKAPSQKLLSIELVPGLYLSQQERTEITPAVMASAASVLVRKSCFQKLGEFDERLPLGYEDVEICWRAWIHGWKTVYVPNAVCWHRVGSSTCTSEGGRMLFRGVLKGRLVLATKLLPFRYAFLTWVISIVGFGKDLSRLQWSLAWNRIRILVQFGVGIPQFLRERRELYRGGGTTATKQLDRMLQLTREEERKVAGPLHGLQVKSAPK
jgi:GT2 family glycosyltransferase